MRFVNELANQQKQDLLILNRSLAMVDQPLEDKTYASNKHLHDIFKDSYIQVYVKNNLVLLI